MEGKVGSNHFKIARVASATKDNEDYTCHFGFELDITSFEKQSKDSKECFIVWSIMYLLINKISELIRKNQNACFVSSEP